MATTTTHYGFTKPATGDNVDITVLNASFDTVDASLYAFSQAIAGTVVRVFYDYTLSKYPVRPSAAAAGMVEWLGPVEPTGSAIVGSGQGWVDYDTWIDNS